MFRALLAACVLMGLVGCAQLPPLDPRAESTALTGTADTRLGRAVAPAAAAHPGLTGIHPLNDARDAFAARVLLANVADRSLDVQYYIWHRDLSGQLLFAALKDAADRGVRVRLLLDDNNTSGLDPALAALDAHPNIEVRLFNPFPMRGARMLGYLTDFSRLNRRMHNKSFTADNQVTIVGGRNVGDEYFGATDGTVFADLDVIAAGPAVQEVSKEFDRYWSSESAYPAARLVPPADEAARAAYAEELAQHRASPEAAGYVAAVRESDIVLALLSGRLSQEWAAAQLVSDDPAKGLDRAQAEGLLTHQVGLIFGAPASRVDLVSPYFVPEQTGVDLFTGMQARGVKVRILTNALEANDVAPVHAGYAKWRKSLLTAGVQLFELKRQAEAPKAKEKDKAKAKAFGGSSGSSLHAKTFAADGRRAFVGSFNFDPRSARLNTELGLIIDSPRLAEAIGTTFDRDVPLMAYEVKLTASGDLVWVERFAEGPPVEYTSEPHTGIFKRALITVLSVLPIDWLL